MTEITPDFVRDHIYAFIASCDTGSVLYIGRDLRHSSRCIADNVIAAAATTGGCQVIDRGEIPTPALALVALGNGAGAIMITGSHIPAGRNGTQFYSRFGENTKQEEVAIGAALGNPDVAAAKGR